MNKLPLLPTTVVGSHAKPSWWHQCKGLIDTGEWGSQDLSELLDDAVDIAILDQERAGLDIITEFVDKGINFGFNIPFTKEYSLSLGISHLENINKFNNQAADLEEDREALSSDSPALCFGLNLNKGLERLCAENPHL